VSAYLYLSHTVLIGLLATLLKPNRMNYPRLIYFSLILYFFSNSSLLFGQSSSPVGIWRSIDDQTGIAKSYIEIYRSGNELKGKIIKLLLDPEDSICELCSGTRKNQKVLGMDILTGLKKEGTKYTGGIILDPSNGKEYKCHIWLQENQKLAVRGYIGMPSIGRTQNWERVR